MPSALRNAPDEARQQAPREPDTEGLSGQGSESVMAHLRELEKKRIERSRQKS